MNSKNKLKLIFAGLLFFALIVFSLSSLFLNPQTKINNPQDNSEKILNINPTNSLFEKPILFYGEGCPHCKKVEEYLKTNKIPFELAQKEIYYNQNNQKELVFAAQACNFNQNEVGVPFLWIPKEKKCIIGDEPIINYLKEIKSNEKNQ